MTLNIASAEVIERQFAMRDLGINNVILEKLMTATDEDLAKTIEGGKSLLARLTGEKADLVAKQVRAAEIEAEMRKGAK